MTNFTSLHAAQRAVYFDQCANPDSAKYNIGLSVEVNGNLNIAILEQAFINTLLDYDALNVDFDFSNNNPQQRFQSLAPELLSGSSFLTQLDYQQASNSKESAIAWAVLDGNKPLDIINKELYRFTLITCSNQCHVLSLRFHHLVIDGYGIYLFYQSLVSHYNSLQKGEVSSLTGGSFEEVVVKEQAYLQSAQYQKDTSFFANMASQYNEQHSPNYKKCSTDKGNWSNVAVIESELKSRLYKTAECFNVSLQQLLMAAMAVYFNRAGGLDHILMGYPVHHRRNATLKKTLGMLTGARVTLVVPDFASDLATLLQHIKRDQAKGYRHQQLPVLEANRLLGLDPHLPLPLVVNYQQQNYSATQFTGCQTQAYYCEVNDPDLPLQLNCFDYGDSLPFTLSLYTRKAYFSAEQAESVNQKLLFILTQFCDKPDMLLNEYKITTPAERLKIVRELGGLSNITAEHSPETIIELVERTAVTYPDALAVSDDTQALTYSELIQRVEQLTQRIHISSSQHKDCKLTGNIMGVCVERSCDQIIAILAVMKTGAAYLPLDYHAPEQRINTILQDSDCNIIITNESLTSLFTNIGEQRLLLAVDALETKNTVGLKSTTSHQSPQPNDLAYIIYTSGTTGVPKGVKVKHAGVVNMLYNQHEACISKPNNQFEQVNCLYFASPTFDAHVSEVFMALCFGHHLIIANEFVRKDLEGLCALLDTKNIGLATIPPALLATKPTLNSSLKTLIFAGESTPESLLEYYKECGVNVINAYGPTENSVCSTMNRYCGNGANNIGKPLTNVLAFILDKHRDLLPIGMSGELYLGGIGLADGYLNRDELTCHSFVNVPVEVNGQIEVIQLYATGDKARWRNDGAIDFCGRIDQQIKIRGHRIEPGEIEQRALQHTQIKHSVLLVMSENNQQKNGTVNTTHQYLVLCYISNNGQHSLDLEKYLEDHLPDYMLPNRLLMLDTFPTTLAGKIDRSRLLATVTEQIKNDSQQVVGKLTETEQLLMTMWQSYFSTMQFGTEQDFFALGGDSIIAIGMISQLRKEGFTLEFSDVFNHKTISALACWLDSSNKEAPQLVVTEQGELTGTFNLLPIQHWFFDSPLKDKNHWNQSFLINVPLLDTEQLADVIPELVKYHDMLTTTFQQHNGVYKGHYGNATLPTLKVHTCENEMIEDLQDVMTQWQDEFTIATGPLWAMGYITGYADGRARVYFAAHHLLLDAVSWRILAKDIEGFYNKRFNILKRRKGTSYRQWQQYLTGYTEQAIKQQDFWLSQVIAPAITVPTTDLSNQYYRKTHQFEPTINYNSINSAHQAYHTQTEELLLVAFAQMLHEWTEQSLLPITLEHHGREQQDGETDLSNTVGWFTTMFPVTLVVSEGMGSTIKSVKECLRATPDRGLSFGVLKYLKNDSVVKDVELPRIEFNYLGSFQSENTDWTITDEMAGIAIDPANANQSLLSVNVWFMNNRLSVDISAKIKPAQANQIIERFSCYLEQVVAHCLDNIQNQRNCYTPSDFPMVLVEQTQLDKLAQTYCIETLLPATPLQQGMIYHSLKLPNDDAYRVQMLWQYQGDIDVVLMKRSWALAINDFPALRSCFNWQYEPILIVVKDTPLEWTECDVSTTENPYQALEQVCQTDRQSGFKLDNAGLFRIQWIKVGPKDHRLLFTVHHSICDGWSGPILFERIHQHYGQIVSNLKGYEQVETNNYYKEKQLSVLTSLQQHTLNRYADCEMYWQDQKKLFVQANDLSLLCGRAVNLNHYSQVEQPCVTSLIIAPDSVQNLKCQASQAQVTLNTLCQFAWHKLIHAYTQDSQTCVGTVVSGRNIPVEGIENSVGLFINTLPMVLDWSNEQSISSVLSDIQKSSIGLNDHVTYNLSNIQTSESPWFNSLFIYENYPLKQTRLNQLLGSKVEASLNTVTEKFDYPFVLAAMEDNGSLILTLHYDGQLLQDKRAEELCKQLEQILCQVSGDLKANAAQLSVLTPQNQQLLTGNRISGRQHNESILCLPQWFEKQVSLTPKRVALVTHNEQLTYSELNSKANQLAHHLVSLSLPSNSLIGLCVNRDASMVAGLLAIMKAGHAYLPLDPSYPSLRLQSILMDAQVPVLFTEEALAVELALDSGIKISIDATTAFAHHSTENLDENQWQASPQDLAYVIYTSGSTGKPKGVMVEHDNLSNFLFSMTLQPGFTSKDTLLAVTSISFDIHTLELWLPLICGGQVVLASREQIHSPDKLAQLIEQHHISVMQGTPSIWKMLKDNEWHASHAMKVLCGGEALSNGLKDQLCENQNIELWNMYGPTETSVWSATQQMHSSTPVTLGNIVDNTEFFVLDDNKCLLPLGAKGTLYIGGSGVTRGYFKQSELTNERFIINPFSTCSERLYDTGDLVRWLVPEHQNQAMTLQYIGRNDLQVKVRGYRIELNEVEDRLQRQRGVRDVLVMPSVNTQYLVAFVVTDKNIEQNSDIVTHWRDAMSHELPDYMCPSAFVLLDALPLLSNGKVDKKALIALGESAPEKQQKIEATSKIEEQFLVIWSELLHQPDMGVTDNFFHLGGNSILAVKLISTLNRECAQQLAIQDVLNAPTVRALASLSDTKVENVNTSEDVALTIEYDPENIHQPFPLTDIQQAYWIGRQQHFQLGNMSSQVYVEFPFETLDIARLQTAWNHLIKRHPMLSMVVNGEGQQHTLEHVPEYTIKPCLITSPESLTALRKEMSQQTFDANQWPLFELCVSQQNSNEYRVHLCLDMLIMDGASSLSLLDELNRLYLKPTTVLAPISITFRDYVLFLEQQKQSKEYQVASQYWLGRVANFPKAPDVPLALAPSQIKEPTFQRHSGLLSINDWTKLTQLAAQWQVTPSVIVFQCFARVLALWSSSQRFTLNLTLFNRLPVHEDIDRVVGDFTTLNLLTVDVSQPDSWERQCQNMQQQLWQDVEHRLFTGVEMQRALSEHADDVHTFPIVVTSALGLSQNQVDNKQKKTVINTSDNITDNVFSLNKAGTYRITQTSQVWLDLQIGEIDGQLDYAWDSVEGLFPEGQIDAMFDAFSEALTHLAHNSGVEHLIPNEQLALIECANHNSKPYPKGLLHSAILEQFVKRPTSIAIKCQGQEISYRQLDERSVWIAYQLYNLAVNKNELVAVLIDKHWLQVSACLGILRSGGAYLPIDPHLPEERIRKLLEQGEVSAVITIEDITAKFTDDFLSPYEIVFIDQPLIQTEITLAQSELIAPQNLQSDLAYVIFTSGSTGTPKGVMIDHLGALNTISDLNETYQVSHLDTVLALSELNFDLSVYDIFGVLGAGGTIVMPNPEDKRNPQAWVSYLQINNVTLWNTVPALMQMLVEYSLGNTDVDHEQFNLRLIFMSGDWIPIDLPKKITELMPNAVQISMGGATEASIWSIYYPITYIPDDWRSVPYGKALANQSMMVLNAHCEYCPVLVEGDIYIGGIGLAKGYWRDDVKTNAAFVRHPLTAERLYRTGDKGRLLVDGNIEFVGRQDDQVKIQGHRIELGEIENCLKQHPKSDDVLVAKVDINQQAQLVAYVRAIQDTSLADKLANPSTRNDLSLAVTLPWEPSWSFMNTGSVMHDVIAEERSKTVIDLSLVSTILRVCFRETLSESVFPKALYPSAGSIYPVQVYMDIAINSVYMQGGHYLPAGSYYYHPIKHELALIKPALISESCYENRIYLVSDLNAIIPFYADYAEPASWLEAGYISQLFLNNKLNQINITRDLLPSDAELVNRFSLSEKHRGISAFKLNRQSEYVAAQPKAELHQVNVQLSSSGKLYSLSAPDIAVVEVLDIVKRKSYRHYAQRPPSADKVAGMLACIGEYLSHHEQLTLYINLYQDLTSSTAQHVKIGCYQYQPANNTLLLINEQDNAQFFYMGNNQTIEQSASFSLCIVANEMPDNYILCGELGQYIGNICTHWRLGSCPIGHIDNEKATALFNLNTQAQVLHTFAFGAVSEKQINGLSIEQDVVSNDLAKSYSLEEQLKYHVVEQLPDYMVPKNIVVVDTFPLTENGKVDRKTLKKHLENHIAELKQVPNKSTTQHSDDELVHTNSEQAPDDNRFVKDVAMAWQDILSRDNIDPDISFFDAGGNSLSIVRLLRKLNEQLSLSINIADLFSYSSINALSNYLESINNEGSTSNNENSVQPQPSLNKGTEQGINHSLEKDDIAIIGIACKLPDANSLPEFWINLSNGKESLQHFSDESLLASGWSAEQLQQANLVKSGFVLPGLKDFDAAYFGMTPKQVELMDPQLRLLYENVDAALEDAGYGDKLPEEDIGVFVSTGESRYYQENLLTNKVLVRDLGELTLALGNSKEYIATRLAHTFNFKGPAVSVNTACSSSLVAIHQAVQSLRAGECSMAFAGAANILQYQPDAVVADEGSIISPTGQCFAFDQRASGTRFSSGSGVVLLKPLSKALEDGDAIHAIIKGSAVNNDGADKIGFTAPSAKGQEAVIRSALKNSQVSPNSIQYIEAHGTGTSLGDPIEINALTKAFGADELSQNNTKQWAMGSVKANAGHLMNTAGIAGLCKVVAAIQARCLPQQINYQQCNNAIELDNTGFYINTKNKPWDDKVCRAGISSFGVGGTNAHVIVEQAPVVKLVKDNVELMSEFKKSRHHLIAYSANTPRSLAAYTQSILDFVEQYPDLPCAELANASNRAKKSFPLKCSIAFDSKEELLELLQQKISTANAQQFEEKSSIVFMYPGQGSQYVGMATSLFRNYAYFRRHFTCCAERVLHESGIELMCFIENDTLHKLSLDLHDTSHVQPLIFSIEYALTKQLMHWGVTPEYLIGHSLGEYVAACVAGVFSLSDAIKLVCKRGELMQSTAQGAMLSVSLSEYDLVQYIGNTTLSLAAVNSAKNCVVSGSVDAISILDERLKANSIRTMLLSVSKGFHSQLMDSILPAFGEVLQNITLNAPRLPVISNLTGEILTDTQAQSIDYWQQHLRQCVRFDAGVGRLSARNKQFIYLEVGPSKTLSSFVKANVNISSNQVINSLGHQLDEKSESALLLEGLGQLWQQGAKLNWSTINPIVSKEKISFPTYCFDRKHYWLDANLSEQTVSEIIQGSVTTPSFSNNADKAWHIQDLIWQSQSGGFEQKNIYINDTSTIIIFNDDCGIGDRIGHYLSVRGKNVHFVRPGRTFSVEIESNCSVIEAGNEEHYNRLIQQLTHQLGTIDTVIHCWNVTYARYQWQFSDELLNYNIYGLMYLTQSLSTHCSDNHPINLSVIANNSCQVQVNDELHPDKAMLGPACRSVHEEFTSLYCQLIDIEIKSDRSVSSESYTKSQLFTLLNTVFNRDEQPLKPYTAIRNNYCWHPTLTEAPQLCKPKPITIKENGVYLIFGGLGAIGLSLANVLSQQAKVTIVLVSRQAVEEYNNLSNELASIERNGGQWQHIKGDINNKNDMENVFATVTENYGCLDGIIHAAGIAGGGLIALKTYCDVEQVLHAKVHGLMNIEAVRAKYSELTPVFFMLCSSSAAVQGGLGQYDYAAANSFLDAWSIYNRHHTTTRYMSVNWDAWRDIGMAANTIFTSNPAMARGLTVNDGSQAFLAILNNPKSQQIVLHSSQASLAIIEHSTATSFSQGAHSLKNTHDRHLSTASRLSRAEDTELIIDDVDQKNVETIDVSTADSTIEQLAHIMQSILGVTSISPQDDFFELGGDSLMLTKVVAQINQRWLINLSMKEAYNKPLMKDLAEIIDELHRQHLTSTKVDESEIEKGFI